MALQHDIVPAESSFFIKKNHVIVELAKAPSSGKNDSSFGGGWEFWTDLGGRKKREGSGKAAAGGADSIMGMMKDLYQEGDDQTRKLIGEAMTKAQSGKGEPMGGMDLGA